MVIRRHTVEFTRRMCFRFRSFDLVANSEHIIICFLVFKVVQFIEFLFHKI